MTAMSQLHIYRHRKFRSDDDAPFEFTVKRVPGDEFKTSHQFDTLDIRTGEMFVAFMCITREELVACRDAINVHLGEKPQHVCDGCGDLYEPSRKPNPYRQQYCDTCRDDGTAERLRKRSQRARQSKEAVSDGRHAS